MEAKKKAVIKDKVELEKIIDYYLLNDISLSLLEDEYALTYPQREFLIQKSMGYSRQQDALVDDYERIDVSSSYLEIPHVIPEENPLKASEQKSLFAKLESIDQEHIVKRLVATNDELSRTKTAITRIMYKNSKEMNLCDYLLSQNSNCNLVEELEIAGIKSNRAASLVLMHDDLLILRAKKQELTKTRDELLEKKRCLIKDNPEYARITDTLVKTNVKLANWVIREFFKNIPLPKEDAQGLALMGLGDAINRFDLSYDCNFSTYATKVISSVIKRHFKSLMGYTWPTYCRKMNINYWRQELLAADKDRTKPFTPEELADSGLVNYSVRQIKDLDKSVDVMYNYSDYYEEPDDSEVISKKMPCMQSDYDYLDAIEDTEGITFDLSDMEQAPYLNIMKESVLKVVGELTEREQKILDLRFGLTSGIEMTLVEVGKEFFISRDRVRQIEAKALRRLRSPERRKKLVDFASDFMASKYYEVQPSRSEYVKAIMHLYDLRKYNLSYRAKAFFASTNKIQFDEEEAMNLDMLMEAFLVNMQFSEKDAYPLVKILDIFADNFGKRYLNKYPYRQLYDALYKRYLKENNLSEYADKEKEGLQGDGIHLIHLALTKKC